MLSVNSFNTLYQEFPSFMQSIVDGKPDYIVPVAKKGCKLLRAAVSSNTKIIIDTDIIKYKEYFEFFDIDVTGKRVAIIDDAAKYTSTLKQYRDFFESRGSTVSTYSFIGHQLLNTGVRKQYDKKAAIFKYFSEPTYQEYLLQQSEYLSSLTDFDIDHISVSTYISKKNYITFCNKLTEHGYLSLLADNKQYTRFALNDFTFATLPFLNGSKMITVKSINKIRFHYDKLKGELIFAALVYPTWNSIDGLCDYQRLRDNARFILPYNDGDISKSSLNNHMNRYRNICYIFSMNLLKAFVQKFDIKSIAIKNYDFDALLPKDLCNNVIVSANKYLNDNVLENFQENKFRAVFNKDNMFTCADELLEELTNGYEQMVKEKTNRIGIKYYISYDEVFERFFDKKALNDIVDSFNDAGVLVSANFERDGIYYRGCRSGEPNSKINLQRTSVIIPRVIQIFSKISKENAVAPMTLNKALANFIYDYPSSSFPQLHTMTGHAHNFGTLVYVSRTAYEKSEVSIYNENISPFYKYDRIDKSFVFNDIDGKYNQYVEETFGSDSEVSIHEITLYFSLMAEIYRDIGKVDVLNALSLCRDENIFYYHIFYNITMWDNCYGNYKNAYFSDDTRLSNLHRAGMHASSENDKLLLLDIFDDLIKHLNKEYVTNPLYTDTVNNILKTIQPRSVSFTRLIEKLRIIVNFHKVLVNLSLYRNDGAAKYKKAYILSIDKIEILRNVEGIKDIGGIITDSNLYTDIQRKIYNKYNEIRRSIPSYSEINIKQIYDERRRENYSYNRAVSEIRSNDYLKVIILHCDLTGYSKVSEDKIDSVISSFYETINNIVILNNSHLLDKQLYGNDCASFLVSCADEAINIAKQISRKVKDDIVLKANSCEIKFGMHILEKEDDLRKTVIKCFKHAIECCNYKSNTYRNYNDFLIKNTSLLLVSKDEASKFELVVNESTENDVIMKLKSPW